MYPVVKSHCRPGRSRRTPIVRVWNIAMAIALPSTLMAGAYPGGTELSAEEERELDTLLRDPPRFHAQAGALFTSEGFSIPGIGKSMFGGGMEAGATLFRLARIYELGASARGQWIAADWLADPAGSGDKFIGFGYRIYLQSVARYVNGMGVRLGLGVDHTFKRERGWSERSILPTYSITILAQARNGLYLYMDLGGLVYQPLTLGVGADL